MSATRAAPVGTGHPEKAFDFYFDPKSCHGSGAPSASVSYSWKPWNDLFTLVHTLGSSSNNVSFTDAYNAAHQITESYISNSAYQYLQTTSASVSYARNGLNQYTNVGDQPNTGPTCGGASQAFTYDCNGNLLSDGDSAYTYDPENRLIAASVAGTGASATYIYDPAGRRRQKTVTGGKYAGTNTQFLSAGDDEIAEYNGSGTLQRRYIPGPAVDMPIAMVTATGARSFFHQDKTGSIIAMTDSAGAIAEISSETHVKDGPYAYDPFGNCTSGVTCEGGVPYKYTGRRYDSETGLYYYRARYYSPKLGRFLQTDPIGYKDDYNLYAYVGNDPTDMTDPSGTEAYSGYNGCGNSAANCVTVPMGAWPGNIGTNGAGNLQPSGRGQSAGNGDMPPIVDSTTNVGPWGKVHWHGDQESVSLAQGALNRLGSTDAMADVIGAKKRSGRTLEVRTNRNGVFVGQDYFINVDMISRALLHTTAGWQNAPGTIRIGHELAHAVLGIGRGFDNEWRNIRLYENPLRRDLGYPIRIEY